MSLHNLHFAQMPTRPGQELWGPPRRNSLVDGPLTASDLLGNLPEAQNVGPLPKPKESGTLRLRTSHPGPPGEPQILEPRLGEENGLRLGVPGSIPR